MKTKDVAIINRGDGIAECRICGSMFLPAEDQEWHD